MTSQEWDRRYAGQELVWTAKPNGFVVAEVQDLAPGRALDVGAGEGRNAVWLASRGWQVTAVDFSVVGLDKGRRLAENRGVAANHRQVQPGRSRVAAHGARDGPSCSRRRASGCIPRP
jgi:2-polyprenyl-3-methyl-5-hydroxy-6-metoxy-1,4-benzoquinol methylase